MHTQMSTGNIPKTFIATRRVIYADCTLGNHVYHSRYLEFLEEARGEFARAAGGPMLELQAQDTIFPVTELYLKYLKPARYDDAIESHLWISELGRIRLRFEYEMRRGPDLLIRGWTLHVCTTIAEKPKRIPEELAEKLRPYLHASDRAPTEGRAS